MKPPLSNAATVRAVETKRAEGAATRVEVEPPPPPPPPEQPPSRRSPRRAAAPSALKEALVAEMQKTKKFFYGTVIAQAQRIDIEGDRIVMAFAQRALKQQLEQSRPWLEEMASRLAGRKMTVVGVDGTGSRRQRPATPPEAPPPAKAISSRR